MNDKNLSDKIFEHESKISSLQTDIENLKGQQDKLERSSSESFSKLDKRLDDLNDKIEKVSEVANDASDSAKDSNDRWVRTKSIFFKSLEWFIIPILLQLALKYLGL